ncbi:response regulator transcription factor [Tessaracoccus defluvii]|uniref:Response regulator transcription factor n=1 Tax=Tessaracoccus defluvii TaxID=1285901 RepID=A0A7H0H8A3_9ACTN|nr:response regulator transcription factor [Tessaracoccus defluvii]QNP56769.1 response regulator transcription factor [Tessaracoccus defluvii]
MRVFLAEDQFLLRQGLENLLRTGGVEVVGSRPDAEGLAGLVRWCLHHRRTGCPRS